MRNIAFIASLICCLVLPDMVSAMPVAQALRSRRPPARTSCPRLKDVVTTDIAGPTATASKTATNSNGDPSAGTDGSPASLAV